MSDQEMHFADPDWQPPHPRAFARHQPLPASPGSPASSAAQPQAGDAAWAASQADEAEKLAQEEEDVLRWTASSPYEEGYRASQGRGDNASQSSSQQGSRSAGQQPRWWRNPWLWSALALLLLLIIIFSLFDEDSLLVIPGIFLAMIALSAIVTFFAFRLQRNQINTAKDLSEIHTFTVGAQPRIIVKDDFGSIQVRAGSQDREVTVEAIRHSFGLLGNPANASVQYEQNDEKNRITIKSRTGWQFLGKTSVDLEVTVPRTSNLDLKTEAGSITVSGVRGQVNCASDAGSVKATQVMLRGDSRLKTDAGSITFSGSLHPYGTYTMTTDAGNVTVTLPEGTAFRIDAKTDVGSIASDFPFAIQRDFPGTRARGDVGMARTYPVLKLRTDVGSINVRQG